ncbi:hypothetical protein NSS82_19115 [Paenibacillus sp. FSL H7-0735]|uniref:hypothetical protein n=1 Tax=Paenibacillus sp. FSL H7-0735 TaxID=2954736 RepID=UPI0030FA03AD
MLNFSELEKKVLKEIFKMKINETMFFNEKGLVRNKKIIIKQNELEELDRMEMEYIKGMVKRINEGKLVIA